MSSDAFSPDWAALHKAIDQCLLKDQFPLRRQLKQIRQLIADHKAADKHLEKLLQRIQNSQQILASRSAPLTIRYPENLPVSAKKDDILRALQHHQVVVVAGETGSGKTTQLPKICLQAGLGIRGRIGHTQPRRLAARAVAQRIAEELGSTLGDAVGYQVRFTDQTADHSRIKLMTDGILLAQTQRDRFLSEYDAIIIDEAHERSLNIDFLLGYLKQLLPKRPDLKVVITSATIDVERFANHFSDANGQPAPVIEVSGRTFPVEMRYRSLVRDNDEEDDRSLFEGIADALAELRDDDRRKGQHGDVLVFLPGEREIRECAEYLRREQLPATDILPLYARLSGADQQKIFRPHGGRRVVLATNVAETSLTVPGIRYVVDSGVARISRYSYRSKVQRLPVEAISQASANQRAGRCGRTEPGICIRLYEESDFLGRDEFTDPEIRRTNLASVILQMLHLRLGKLQDFPFIDPPDDRFIKDGFTLLQELEAVDSHGNMTELGAQMARLPVDPRIARMLLEARQQQCLSEVLIIAAALSVQDPRERPQDKQQAADEKHRLWRHEDSDFLTLVNLWQAFDEERQQDSQNQLRKWCKKHFLSYMRLREWRDTHRQLHLLAKEMELKENPEPAGYDAIHKALLAGMLSQIGFKSEGQEYLGARNRKLFIFPASGQYKKKPKWMMAAELVETSKLFARTVARIEPEWIEEIGRPLLKFQYFEPHWNKQRGQVTAFEQSTLYGLVVNPRKRVNYAQTHAQEARDVFIQEALVEQKLQSKLPFYQHNVQLLQDVTEYEEKARRRDLVIDDDWQAAFYRDRLPQEFISQRHLERWFEKAPAAQKEALFFTREQLLSPEAAGIGATDFPPELEWQGMAFPLSYTFAPGTEDDGVTLSVPVAMLQQVPDARVEWLVPGFVSDKVAAIIKALPKAVRKNFVPVPATAEDFLHKCGAQQGGLYIQLLNYLNENLRPKLELSELLETDIPEHLKMNIRVMSEGKILDQGRDLALLKERWQDAGQHQVQTLTHEGYQRSDIRQWDFGDLPEHIQSELNGLPVRAFPCLKAEGNQLQLTVEANENQARRYHRQGLNRLFRLSLPDQERMVRDLIKKKVANRWLMAKGMGSQQDITDDIAEAVFMQVFLPADEPLPLSKAEFEQRLQRRADVIPQAEKLLAEFCGWLELRHQILKNLSGAVSLDRAMAYSDVKAHLQRLLARGFMAAQPWTQLQCYTRYLKAMAYRIDKLQGNQARDRQSMIEFESLWEPYQDVLKRVDVDDHPALREFGWLLEEWRVSLFAQPLGTREPVSLKRLNKRWLEIRDI